MFVTLYAFAMRGGARWPKVEGYEAVLNCGVYNGSHLDATNKH